MLEGKNQLPSAMAYVHVSYLHANELINKIKQIWKILCGLGTFPYHP